jgi:hypothetical protein
MKSRRLFVPSLVLAGGVASGSLPPIGSAAGAQALLWVTRAGGVETDESTGIATTERDSYVTGRFRGTATFGEGEPNETTLTSAGGSDIFVAKYDRDGALLWATRAGGGSLDFRLGIATTERGDSYVTGAFEGTATFGQGANERPRSPLMGGSISSLPSIGDLDHRSGPRVG